MLRKYLRFLVFAVVTAWFFSAHAGSFADFFRSVRQDDVQAVQALLQRGFDPNTIDEKGLTGLFIALRDEYPKVARLLAGWPATQPEFRSPDGESTLMMACLRGNEDIARLLVERGADVNKPGWTPLHYAATGGHAAIAAFLLDQNAYIDADAPNGNTPLMMAALYGNAETVKLLLDAGADASLRNRLGMSALDLARRGERPDAIRLLEQAQDQRRREKPPGKW